MTIERYDTITTEKGRLPDLSFSVRASAHLLVTQGEGIGRQVEMKDTPLIVGRSSDCDMRLLNRAVSRLHCRVWKDGSGFWLRDLNSTNKTYLNERPVVEARLKDGDLISVGGTIMQFIEKVDAPEAPSIVPLIRSNSVEIGGSDALTGLLTKRVFEGDIDREIARCRRHARSFVLAILDVDGLATVNRDFGEAAGDEVLRQVGRMIRSGLRVEDLAARIGGDEIGLLLTEVSAEHGVPILQSIRTAAGNADFAFVGRSFRITVSVGAAVWDPSIVSRVDLQARAQAELKHAKDLGRNRVCCG